MPDLTIVYMQQCKSLSYTLETRIGGYKQQWLNTGFPNCTCKGWVYARKDKRGRKVCKHINQAKEEMCGWHEQFGEAQRKEGICPDCGGPTETVKVGV